MESLELKAEPRQVVKSKVKELRRQGLVPAVIYGRDVEAEPLQLEERALGKVLSVAGSHQLISLKIGDRTPRMTLARDIQRDVIKRNYLHVDFYAVKMDEKVTAQVPLVLEGVSPAVQDLGGVLTQALDSLEIECLPADLIASVEVNIGGLAEFNSSISASDLQVPDTITVLTDPDALIVRIEAPRLAEEEVEEVSEEDDIETSAEPEVITEARSEE